MKAWLSFSNPISALVIEQKVACLSAAALDGKKFVVVPCEDPKESAEWILASFESSLAVLPISSALPAPEKARLLAQLPAGEWIETSSLTKKGKGSSSPKRLDQIWAVIFSSGSSGQPKGVALSGGALRASALAHQANLGDHTWLLNLPLYHVGGFSVISRAHFLSLSVALAGSRFSAQETLEWIRSGRISGISLVPTTLQRLLRESTDRADFTSLQVALLGGAPTEDTLLSEAMARGLPALQTYGLTETASQAATELAPGAGMRALPGYEIRIKEGGEILVRSPSLASGIYHKGRLEPLALDEQFYATGDLGELRDGRLKVLGRKSDMMISGGLNVFPAELEAALNGCPGVEDAAALPLPDSEWGEIVCLAAVGNFIPDSVNSYLAARIDKRKLPKTIVKLAEIPRSSTGKVLRAELIQRVREILRR